MEWSGKLSVMLCCIHKSVSLLLYHEIYVVCALCKLTSVTPSTGRVSDLCDPSSMADSRDVHLLQCENIFDMLYCGSTGLGQLLCLMLEK